MTIITETPFIPGTKALTPEEKEILEISRGCKRCWKTKEWLDQETCESSGKGEGCKYIKECPVYKSFN